MKKLLLLALATVTAGCGHVLRIMGQPQIQGSGKVTTVSRQVPGFKALQLDGAMDADVSIGTQSDLKIEGDDNIAPLVKTEVIGDTLRVWLDGSYSTNNGIKVKVTVPELRSAVLNGSGDIAVHKMSGESLELKVRGSGSIDADGKVRSLDASISGSGDLNLHELAAERATIGISGSGGARVSAAQKLDVSISGSGNVTYSGSPTLTKSVSGSGDVTQG